MNEASFVLPTQWFHKTKLYAEMNWNNSAAKNNCEMKKVIQTEMKSEDALPVQPGRVNEGNLSLIAIENRLLNKNLLQFRNVLFGRECACVLNCCKFCPKIKIGGWQGSTSMSVTFRFLRKFMLRTECDSKFIHRCQGHIHNNNAESAYFNFRFLLFVLKISRFFIVKRSDNNSVK